MDFLPGWEGGNPVDEFSRRFQVSVAMENDADAAALAEAGWGAGKGKGSLIYVTIGTGIGGGIILNGQLYRGAAQAHPEIGHHVIDPSGPHCFYGAQGCWEVLAAGPAMVKWLKGQAPPDDPHLAGLTAKKNLRIGARRGAMGTPGGRKRDSLSWIGPGQPGHPICPGSHCARRQRHEKRPFVPGWDPQDHPAKLRACPL